MCVHAKDGNGKVDTADHCIGLKMRIPIVNEKGNSHGNILTSGRLNQ